MTDTTGSRPTSGRERYAWRAMLALAFILVSLNAYRLLATRGADPDQFWHVATGRYIIQHHEVPKTDPFSWYGSQRQARWIAHEWLFGVIAYGLHSLGGFRLLYIFAALLDGLMFLLAYWLSYVRSKREWVSVVIAALVVLGTYPNLAPRPQMFTFCALLAIALLGEKKKLWWALPIVLVGANIHGGAYPIYLIVLGFYAIPSQPLPLLAAIPLVLVNPNGVTLLSYALGVTNPDAHFINEFRPTELATRPLDLATYLGVLVVMWGQRLKLKDAVFVFALLLLSLSAVRQVAFFYLLVLPILAPYVPQRMPARQTARESDTVEELTREGPALPAPARASLSFVMDVAPFVLLGFLVTSGIQYAARLPIDVDHGYPAGAARYVKTHSLDRIFNVWGDGGYLIYNGVPPMIDGRGDPFMAEGNHGVDMAHDYLTTLTLGNDPRWFFDRYQVRNIVVKKGMNFYRALQHDPSIEVLYEDANDVVMRYTPPRSDGVTVTP